MAVTYVISGHGVAGGFPLGDATGAEEAAGRGMA